MLSSSTVITLLSVSPFKSVNICLTYLGVCMLDTYLQRYNYLLAVLTPLCYGIISFTVFVLKSISSDINIATAAFFFFGFYLMGYLFLSHFQSVNVFRFEVGLLLAAWGLGFIIF